MENIYKFFAFGDLEAEEDYSMNEFFKKFDPIELKYSPVYDSTFCCKEESDRFELKHRLTLPIDVRSKVSKFENQYNKYGSLSKQKYNYIEDNLQLVYGDDSVVHNDVTNYHNIEKN